MANFHDDRPPLIVAAEWVGKITGVALEMVLPGLLGTWLDRRWGTGFLALVGFGLGITVAIWHLLRITSLDDDGGRGGKTGPGDKVP